MQYTIDYFIDKFEAIPEDQWTTQMFIKSTACCAMGHCGVRTSKDNHYAITMPPEAVALANYFETGRSEVEIINDNENDKYPQKTPKQRILAALRDIKAGVYE